MALVERLMHEDSEPHNRWISVHEFFSAMSELAGGALTKNQIELYYSMTPDDIVDFDILVNLTPKSGEGRLMMVNRVHSIFILSEHNAQGYSTPTDVRSKISSITFLIPAPKNYLIAPANNAWNNMPAALTEILGNQFRRIRVNLENADAIRITANITTQGATNAVLFAQYSTDQSNWNTLTSNLSLNPVGFKVTAWESVPVGARSDVYIRVVGQNGDNTADPVICQLALQVI